MRWKLPFFTLVGLFVLPFCMATLAHSDEEPSLPAEQQKTQQPPPPVEAKTFDLEVVDIFTPPKNEEEENALRDGRRGMVIYTKPDRTEGAKYPKFHFAEPRFGTLKLGRNDLEPGSEVPIAIAVDVQDEAGEGYDLFYVDRNGNQDLTDDEPLVERTFTNDEEKKNYLPPYFEKEHKVIVFEPIQLSWAGTKPSPDYQIHAFAITGTYTPKGAKENETKRFATLCFRYPTLRVGTIKIAQHEYKITLTNLGLSPNFANAPCIEYQSATKDTPPIYWWGARTLNAAHLVDGHYYTMKLSADSKKLTVSPYTGKLGTLRPGLGGRSLEKSESKKVLISGGLNGKPHCAAIGNYSTKGYNCDKVSEMQLPVGDYSPALIDVDMGDITLHISNNYHQDGKPRSVPPTIFAIKIREDKPYVFDLSNTPEVLFVQPAKQTTVARGEMLQVKPVLIDPVLGIMFRDMKDHTQQVDRTFEDSDNKRITYKESKSLEPLIEITNSKGEVVNSGTAEYG